MEGFLISMSSIFLFSFKFVQLWGFSHVLNISAKTCARFFLPTQIHRHRRLCVLVFFFAFFNDTSKKWAVPCICTLIAEDNKMLWLLRWHRSAFALTFWSVSETLFVLRIICVNFIMPHGSWMMYVSHLQVVHGIRTNRSLRSLLPRRWWRSCPWCTSPVLRRHTARRRRRARWTSSSAPCTNTRHAMISTGSLIAIWTVKRRCSALPSWHLCLPLQLIAQLWIGIWGNQWAYTPMNVISTKFCICKSAIVWNCFAAPARY